MFIIKPTKLQFQSPIRRGGLSATQLGLGTQLELMVWVQFPASVTGFLCVLRQPPSSAPWLTSSFVQWRSSSSRSLWAQRLLMLLKDVDVVMGRATLETRVREVCFLTGDSHPCCLHFCVKEERKLFPDLKRGDFFLSKSFRPISLWSLAAQTPQSAAACIWKIPCLSPFSAQSVCLWLWVTPACSIRAPGTTQWDQKHSFCHLPTYVEVS